MGRELANTNLAYGAIDNIKICGAMVAVPKLCSCLDLMLQIVGKESGPCLTISFYLGGHNHDITQLSIRPSKS